MPEHPKPRRYLRGFSSATSPHLIQFDDGERYVVKFKGNPSGNHVLVSEYVVSELIQLLQFSGRPGRIVAVDAQYISLEPNLQGQGLTGGLQFGSPFLDDYENFSDIYIPHLKNRVDLPQVIVLDTLVCNADRHSGNLLLLFEDKTRQNKACDFVIIDHSHVFERPGWDEHSLRTLQSDNRLYANVVNFNNIPKRLDVFEPFLLRLEALTQDQIEAVISNVPTEWDFSSTQQKALRDFLVLRKGQVRGIISHHLNP